MHRYRAAIVGCGRIGLEFDEDPKRKYAASHAGAYSKSKKTKLAAVADLDESKLKKCRERWLVPAVYKDFKDMLKKEKIDILSICTPPASHLQILKESVNHRLKAIFCEKPISTSIKDAKQMVALCKKNNIILQIGHQRRFDPLHFNLRKLVANKTFGDVQQVNFYYTAGIKNTGSHMFDVLRFFFGDVEWIEAFYSKNESAKFDDPNLDGILKFKSGALATFQACDFRKYLLFELNCLLEKGRFILKNSGFSLDFYRVSDSLFFSGYKELYKTGAPLKTEYNRNFLINAVEHLTECIRCGKESISSGEDGLKALELIELAVLSAKNKGKRIYI